jgi:hypothetical protein
MNGRVSRAVAVLTVLLAAVSLSSAAAGTIPRGSARHAPTSSDDLIAVAGTPHYLAFERVGRTQLRLMVMSRHGTPRTVLMKTRFGAQDFSLVGSMLVYHVYPETGPVVAHWLDLTTGKSGQTTEQVVSAAPHGWIVCKRVEVGGAKQDVLYYDRMSGKVTRLGIAEKANYPFQTSVDSKYVVISQFTDEGTGAARFVSFARPGRFHTLVKSNPGDFPTACSTVLDNYAACFLSRHVDVMRLYDIHSGRVVASNASRCAGGYPAILSQTVAWISQVGCPHQLRLAGPGTRFAMTATRFAEQPPISAFGGVVVATSSKHKLVIFTSATNRETLVSS